MIEIEELGVSYGSIQVLWDISATVSEGDDIIAIVGPNGAGKSTLLRAMSGLLHIDSGGIFIRGDPVTELAPAEIVRRGFVHVPEERNLFGEMTVRENLEMGAYTERDSFDENLPEVYDLFPVLEEHAEKKAGSLSGGQQQMLAIGRGLMAEPDVLALDEPSEGLAPQIKERVFEKIEAVSEDVTVILVEQHVHDALSLAETAYLLENGKLVAEDEGTALLESDHVQKAYL